ncbi:hypothetical protein CIW48_32385 [Methylobacterium sp. P1-11]|nr:hypothetical protein CIW48_32385 [Methylobacterium sp. P1-11]
MRHITALRHNFILLTLLAGLVTLSASPASAFVCARGFYRAGCIGPWGGVAVQRGFYGPRAVVYTRSFRRW